MSKLCANYQECKDRAKTYPAGHPAIKGFNVEECRPEECEQGKVLKESKKNILTPKAIQYYI